MTSANASNTSFHRNAGFARYSSGLTENSQAPVSTARPKPVAAQRTRKGLSTSMGYLPEQSEQPQVERQNRAEQHRNTQDVRGIDE